MFVLFPQNNAEHHFQKKKEERKEKISIWKESLTHWAQWQVTFFTLDGVVWDEETFKLKSLQVQWVKGFDGIYKVPYV